MTTKISLDQIYEISEDIVVREIEGELLIVPISSGIGDMEDELYTMNDTGKEIIQKINGKNTLAEIALELSHKYKSTLSELERDVLGLVNELIKRNMVIKIS